MKIHQLDKIMIPRNEILGMVSRMADEITERLKDYEEDVRLIYVENGAIFVCEDLENELFLNEVDFTVDSIKISSYDAGTQTSGRVRLVKHPDMSFAGMTVLIVEDIVDTGLSMSCLKEYFLGRGAVRVLVASLLSKPSRRRVDVQIDFLGREIPDEFVVGYGLDFKQKYRDLEDIWTVKVMGFWAWLGWFWNRLTEGR